MHNLRGSNIFSRDVLMPDLILHKKCPECLCVSQMRVDKEAYNRWQRGELIQVAFPGMTPSRREQLKTGIHPSCWDTMFEEVLDGDD